MDNLFNKLSQVVTSPNTLAETVLDDFKRAYGPDIVMEKQVQENFSTYKVQDKAGKQLAIFTIFTD